MIKEKDLREKRPQVRFAQGQNIDLSVVQSALQQNADENGIPVAFSRDQVKYGGLIGGLIGGGTDDCLILSHPQHPKDYFRICIRVKHQGNYAFVSVNDFGESRLLGNAATSEYTKNAVKDAFHGGSAAGAVGAVIGKGLRTLVMGGSNKQKLEEEQNWYAMVSDLFDNIIS